MADRARGGGKSAVRRVFFVIGKIFAVLGKILGTLLLVGLLTGLIFACRFAKYVQEDLSRQTHVDLDDIVLDQTSVIYYSDPKTNQPVELLRLYGSANRTWVSYDKIPKDLINACVAIEDKRFYEHHGVDWLRTASASANMFIGGDSTYGASTLTQQLIKNATGRDEVTVRRKLLEIFSALDFENSHSKDEILTWYLNTIYLGEGCYGVQSASQVYFGKNVWELTTAECASLISITNNPSIYDPYINEEKNRERQVTVLYEMYDQGYILTEQDYRAAVNQELVFRNTSGQDDGESEYYSYFVDQVIRDVTRGLCERFGYSEKLAEQLVRSGGYSIYCTLNPEVQAQVDAVYENLENIPRTESAQQLQSGIAVIDNASGDLVAVAGGVGEKTGSLTYNRATQALLSPGSTIKPLTVYGPALELGLITPASVYDDTPFSFEGGRWPKNTDNTYRGLMTVNSAVGLSTNTVAVKVLSDVTLEYSFRFAKEKLGLDTLEESVVIGGSSFTDMDYAPLALGGLTRGVTIQDMAAAYAAFPNQGTCRSARTYTKVTRTVDGKEETVLDNTQESVQAFSERTAWYTTYMLQNAVETGTGQPGKLENMAAAGKTGTTTSDFDRWFCGYTPYYTAAVWCGYDTPEEVVLTEDGPNPALYLWQQVMSGIHEKLEPRNFRQPGDVILCTYCRDSGKLATEACKSDPRGNREIQGLLALDDAPDEYCDVHTMVEVCDESGSVVNRFCAQVEGNSTHKMGLIKLLRAYPESGVVVGDQLYVVYNEEDVPRGMFPALSLTGETLGLACTIHNEESLPQEEEEEEEDPDGAQDDDPPDDPRLPPAEEPGAIDPIPPIDPIDPIGPVDPWMDDPGSGDPGSGGETPDD